MKNVMKITLLTYATDLYQKHNFPERGKFKKESDNFINRDLK